MNVPSLLALLSLTAVACAPAQAAPPPVSSNVVATSAPVPPPPAPRPPSVGHVYRLDFVLTVADSAAPPTTTSFTMNLVEHDGGEVTVGKNVAINGTAPGAPPSPRQDVGLKVKASLKDAGDGLFLQTTLELSSFEPPSSIRKVVEQGDALAIDGKPSLVNILDDDKKHYQLTVTPTKLR